MVPGASFALDGVNQQSQIRFDDWMEDRSIVGSMVFKQQKPADNAVVSLFLIGSFRGFSSSNWNFLERDL